MGRVQPQVLSQLLLPPLMLPPLMLPALASKPISQQRAVVCGVRLWGGVKRLCGTGDGMVAITDLFR